MPNLDHETRWRQALKLQGAARVRQRLQDSPGDAAATSAITGIVSEPPHPPRRFVDSWYRDAQRRTGRARHVWLYAAAVIALGLVSIAIMALVLR